MKKTSLFSIALLLSTILVAQTSIQNSGAVKGSTSIQSNKSGAQSNSNANASSQTNLKSDAVTKAKSKTFAEIQKEKKAAADTRNSTQATLTQEEKKSMKSQDFSASASAQSGLNSNVSTNNNNTGNNTSMEGGSTLSISSSKTNADQIVNKGKSEAITKSNSTVESRQKVATHVNESAVRAEQKGSAIISSAVKVGSASATTIKPRPVSIKTNTIVKTTGGIQLR